MSRVLRKYFEGEFKVNRKRGHYSQLLKLANYKSTKPAEFYDVIIESFKISAKDTTISYLEKGRGDYKELLWAGIGNTTNLINEFKFASAWLKGSSSVINNFRSVANQVQTAILIDDFELAHDLIIGFRKDFGWTMWGLELEIALVSKVIPWTEARKYFTSLIDGAPSRMISLIIQILMDRNDESISVDHFFRKCKASFPKIGADEKFINYLFYRATSSLNDPEISFPAILACDFNNSIVDYYESMIDQFCSISIESDNEHLKTVIRDITEKLYCDGFTDYRLKKINFLVGGTLSPDSTSLEISNELKVILNVLRNSPASINDYSESTLVNSLVVKIRNVINDGAIAQEDITDLLTMGINYRGLSIFSGIGNFSVTAGYDFASEHIYSPWIQFASPLFHIEDVLCINSKDCLTLLESITKTDLSEDVKLLATKLSDGYESAFTEFGEVLPNNTSIWICYQLIKQDLANSALLISKELEKFGKPWSRNSRKISVWAHVKNDNIEEALEVAGRVLISGIEYANELPLKMLISENKWNRFKKIDPALVALVADAAQYITSDSRARYICRMACRNFITSGQRFKILESWSNKSVDEKEIYLTFMKNVWVDENLNMSGFETTQEVRQERINMLQILLQVDISNELVYANEIKELTFKETLWKGLRHINETRIFVNESAITKWAEKEIFSEVERWKLLTKDKENLTPILDNAINQYLINMDLDALKKSLQKESISESEAIFVGIVDRLLRHFLTDPADGLDCYLSARIRHGSLKGTLLGPLEEAGIIGSTEEDLNALIRKHMPNSSNEKMEFVKAQVAILNNSILDIINRLLKDIIQIRSTENPSGYIYASVDTKFLAEAFIDVALNSSFRFFISTCYEIFWQLLFLPLTELSNYLRNEIKNNFQKEFDQLIRALHLIEDDAGTLISSIKSIATKTQSECELVANWFQSEKTLEQQIFSLNEAIEIAKASTKNVYRLFPTEIVETKVPSIDVPLTSYGLSALTDCLYVMLENVWKHSGFGTEIAKLTIDAEMDVNNKVLVIKVSNPLSEERILKLKNGEFDSITASIASTSMKMVSLEGGSGIPKLARLVRDVNKSIYPNPLKIDFSQDMNWVVTICIPLYKRGEAYDAYFE